MACKPCCPSNLSQGKGCAKIWYRFDPNTERFYELRSSLSSLINHLSWWKNNQYFESDGGRGITSRHFRLIVSCISPLPAPVSSNKYGWYCIPPIHPNGCPPPTPATCCAISLQMLPRLPLLEHRKEGCDGLIARRDVRSERNGWASIHAKSSLPSGGFL